MNYNTWLVAVTREASFYTKSLEEMFKWLSENAGSGRPCLLIYRDLPLDLTEYDQRRMLEDMVRALRLHLVYNITLEGEQRNFIGLL
jgi:hypothetical protein